MENALSTNVNKTTFTHLKKKVTTLIAYRKIEKK